MTNEAKVAQAVQLLLGSESWAQMRRVLGEHPELMTEEADQILTQMVEIAGSHGDSYSMLSFEVARDLLRDCRSRGIVAALESEPDLRSPQAQLEELLQDVQLKELVSLIRLASQAEASHKIIRLLEQKPKLLAEESLAVLAQLEWRASRQGQLVVSRFLQDLRKTLKRMRAAHGQLSRDV
jgi:hypothetical protein